VHSLSPGAASKPESSKSDDRWDIVLDEPAAAPAVAAPAVADPEDERAGTLAFGRAEDGSFRPLSRDVAPAPTPPPQPTEESRNTVDFFTLEGAGNFAIPPPQMLSEPPTGVAVLNARSAPKVTILGAGRLDPPLAGERAPLAATLDYPRQGSAAISAAPLASVAPAPAAVVMNRREEAAFAATLAFQSAPPANSYSPIAAATAPPSLRTSTPANDGVAPPPRAAPPPPRPAPPTDAAVTTHSTALAGGAALLAAGLLAAPTGATDTVAFLLAGGALLATTVAEMSPLQRAWSAVAVGLPLLVIEVGAHPMLPGLAAALAALVVAALGGALAFRVSAPTSSVSRDALAGTVVAGAAWMIAPGAGGLADATHPAAPLGWVAPLLLPTLIAGLAALLPAVARRASHALLAAPALWCAALPFLQALDLARPTASTQLIAAHALASLCATSVTSLALGTVLQEHSARA
jgi:hypothetical protein